MEGLLLISEAGAGKTLLVTSIIDHYIEASPGKPVNGQSRATPEGYFCFFYCLRVENERREAVNILRSFVKQLALANDETFQVLRQQYDRRKRSGFLSEEINMEECEIILKDMLAFVSMAVLVIDALDECFENTRLQLVDLLVRLLDYGLPLKVLLSSRRDGDIKEKLEERANISISATDNEQDIMKFARERISHHRATRRGALAIPADLEEEILNTIQVKSDGM